MFGKRNASTEAVARPTPLAPPPLAAGAPPKPAAPPVATPPKAETGQVPQRSAPLLVTPSPKQGARAVADTRSEDYYQIKSTIFSALIDTIDLAQLAQLDPIRRARKSRHRQRDHLDQERRDVDRRAGTPAAGHLQRRARLRPARALAGARRHLRHHGQRRQPRLHRSQRQGPAHQHPLPRQRAADEHLPAHRQPGRPPRRRELADLRRAPARRLPASTSSPRPWRSTGPRSPSASSRRTS